MNINYTDLISIYSWSGEKIKDLKLSKEISSFDVSMVDKKIYAISKNDITFLPEIIKFSFE